MAKSPHLTLLRKGICGFVAFAFSISLIIPPSMAQLANLPAPGQMMWLTPAFQPPVLRGMTVHPENPLLFDFIVDRGQDKLQNQELKAESEKLIKYFLASMTIPDKDSWVNLSPYEKDRIIPDALGQTEMGRQMLEQDYILKQLSASLTNPDKELGQKFWNEVRSRAQKQFGTTDVPLSTFNKVWIVPDGATVVEKDGFVYITESKLKVMLDQDYVAEQHSRSPEQAQRVEGEDSKVSALSSQVFREMILPKLIEEVNTGKNFAQTRQVYQSVILSAWYKKALKDSLLGKIYADKSKVHGVETDVKDIKQKVYEQYLAAFKKGAYNVIKEESNGDDLIPRKYFSGGLQLGMGMNASSALIIDTNPTHMHEAMKKITQAGSQNVLVSSSTIETQQGADYLSANEVNQSASSGVMDSTGNSKVPATPLQSRIENLPQDLSSSRGIRLNQIDQINDKGKAGGIYTTKPLFKNGIIYKVETDDIDNGDIGRYRFHTNEVSIIRYLNDHDIPNVPQLLEYGYAEGTWAITLRVTADDLRNFFNEPPPSILNLTKQMLKHVRNLDIRSLFEPTAWEAPLRSIKDLSTRLTPQAVRDALNIRGLKFSILKTSPYMKLQGLADAQSLVDSQLFQSFSYREKLGAFITLAGMYDQIHAAGVIHNDIREANILVNKDEKSILHYMIIDFSHSLLVGEEDEANAWLSIPSDRHRSTISGDMSDFAALFWRELVGDSVVKEIEEGSLRIDAIAEMNELALEMMYPDKQSPKNMREVASRLEILLENTNKQAGTKVSENRTRMWQAFKRANLTYSFLREFNYPTDMRALEEVIEIVKTPKEGIEVKDESGWIFRGQFSEPDTERGSLNVNITPELINDLDQLLRGGVIKGYYKVGKPYTLTSPDKRHDSVTIYFVTEPTKLALKSLGRIARKYLRGTGDLSLLGRKISDGFYMSEIGAIPDRHAENLIEQIARFDRFSGKLFRYFFSTTYLNGVTQDRISMSEAQYYAVKEGLNTVGLDFDYDREKGFNLHPVETGPTAASSAVNPGGIDFDSSKLNLQIKRDGRGVPLPLIEQNFEQINIEGLYPVIINIQPINTQTLPILGQLDTTQEIVAAKS